jgi:hypothetical protein
MKGSLMLNFIFFFGDVGIQVKILELFYVRRKDPVDFYIRKNLNLKTTNI